MNVPRGQRKGVELEAGLNYEEKWFLRQGEATWKAKTPEPVPLANRPKPLSLRFYPCRCWPQALWPSRFGRRIWREVPWWPGLLVKGNACIVVSVGTGCDFWRYWGWKVVWVCFLGECKGMFSDSVKLVYFFTGLFSFDYIRIRLFTLGSLFSMRYQSRQMILRIMIVEKNVIFLIVVGLQVLHSIWV